MTKKRGSSHDKSNIHDKKPKQAPRATQPIEENEYVIEKILNKKDLKGKIYYFVKWEGYPDSDNTWEPIEHLYNVLDMIEEFETGLEKQSKTKTISDNEPSGVELESQNVDDNRKGLKERDLNCEEEIIIKKRKTSIESTQKNLKDKKPEEMFSISPDKILLSSEFDLSGAKIIVNGNIRSQKEIEKKFKKQKEIKKKKTKESQKIQETEEKSEKENDLIKENKLTPEKVEKEVINEETEKKNHIILENAITTEKVDNWEKITDKLNAEVFQGKKSLTNYSYKSSNEFETPKIRDQGNELRISQRPTEEVKVNLKTEGSFTCEDKPRRIISIKKRKQGFWFLLEWEERENGAQPKDSYVTNEEMKDFAPRFLIDFYESKIIVLKDPKEKKDPTIIKKLVEKTKINKFAQNFDFSDQEDDEISGSKKKKVIKPTKQ